MALNRYYVEWSLNCDYEGTNKVVASSCDEAEELAKKIVLEEHGKYGRNVVIHDVRKIETIAR